jgi:hypothetical protein
MMMMMMIMRMLMRMGSTDERFASDENDENADDADVRTG